MPLGATHVMSSTSNVASAPDRTNGTFPERFASRWSTKRATGRQRPRTYLSAANSTHESHVMSITSSVASASPPAPPASSFKGSRALTRGASRRTGPRRRGKGNNERYTKAKAAAAAAAAREAGGEDGGEGAESESGAEHGKAGGGSDDGFYSTPASAAALAAEREAAMARAQVAIEVDAGDGDLISVLNRLEGTTELDLGHIPHWIGEQYGTRAVELNLSQGFLTGLSSLAAFTVIKVLILDNNRLDSLSSLPALPLLTTLSIRHNKLEDLDGALQAIKSQTPALRQLAFGGNPCTNRVHGQLSGLKLRLKVVTVLPALSMLDSKPARKGMHPLWIMDHSIWTEKIAKHLSIGDLCALSETCTTGTEIARSIVHQTNVQVPWTAGGTGILQAAIKLWPNIRFEAVCNSFGELDAFGAMPGLAVLNVQAPVLGSKAMSKVLNVLQAPRAVQFEGCNSITACPKLPNVETITFKDCGQLNLVTALSTAKSIVLEDCPKLKMIDVIYRLANAESVTLKGCRALSAVGDLGGKTVCLSETINGHRREWKRKTLDIQRAPSLASLRGLGSVHTLILKKCSGLQSLAGLETVHTVVLEACPKVRDLSPITSCQSVTLIDMGAIVDASMLGSCPDVTFESCLHVKKLPHCNGSAHAPLLQRQRIQVLGCPLVSSVQPLAGAAHVIIDHCTSLSSLDGLEHARSVTVRYCPAIEDVSVLVDVPRVQLEGLKSVRDTSMLHGDVVETSKGKGTSGFLTRRSSSRTKSKKVSKAEKGAQQITPGKSASARDTMLVQGREGTTPEKTDLDLEKAAEALEVVRTLQLGADSPVEKGKQPEKKGFFSGWFSSPSSADANASASADANADADADADADANGKAISATASPSRKLLKAQKKVAKLAEKTIKLAEKAEALKQKEASEADEGGSTDFESDGEEEERQVARGRGRGKQLDLDSSSSAEGNGVDTTQDIAERDATSSASSAGKKMWTDRKLTEEEFFLEQLTAASGYIDLGHACRNEKEYDSAVAFFYKALGTYRALPESNATLPVKIANVYTNLGVVYGLRKLHEKEMDLFKKALQCYRDHHGFEHVNTAMAFNNLGIASRNSGDRSAAMNYFKKALSIYRGLYGERHPESIRTQRNIDRLQSVWNSRSATTATVGSH